MFWMPKREPKNFKKSYSQCGEDIIVEYIFSLRGIEKPSYIDIGAHDPFFLSNTALFYEKGSRGINVEANKYLLDNFNLKRPNDINLNIGIGAYEGELDFFIMTDSSLSSFSEIEVQELITYGKNLDKVEKIQVKTIHNILLNHCNEKFPDFLSIDIEGKDLEVLSSINFEISSPKVICVEAAEYSPIGAGRRRSELVDFLISKGYYEYANTNLNSIMVEKNFWFI